MLIRDRLYTVYKHTSPSGKVYIGITSQSVERRWQSGVGYANNDYFTKAITKYGWKNFSHEILDTGLSIDDAEAKEKEYIQLFRSNDRSYGYNLSSGGEAHDGCKFSEESRKKMSDSHIGHTYVMAEDHKKAISLALKGKKKSEEHIRHLRGRCFSDAHREKLSAAKRSIKKRVLCVETREAFDSAYDAKKKYGTHPASINRSCKSGCRAGGYHWLFIDNDLQANTEVTTEPKESVAP